MSRATASGIVGCGALDLTKKLGFRQRPRVVDTLEYDDPCIPASTKSTMVGTAIHSISEAEKDKYRAEGARQMSEAAGHVLAVVGAIKQYVSSHSANFYYASAAYSHFFCYCHCLPCAFGYYTTGREATSHGAYERERQLHAGASAAAQKVFGVPLPQFPSSQTGALCALWRSCLLA
jgi:hypothetical protein